ncbi:MAG: Flp pilus assembly protein CpaB [Steroidobacteraceae bacterium]
MKISPRWIVLGAASFFGLSAGFGAHSYIQSRVTAIEASYGRIEYVKQIVPKRDLSRGARLTVDSVAVRSVPKQWAYQDALTPEQLPRFENTALQGPAREGQPILWSQVASPGTLGLAERLEPGRRALTVPVDEISSMSGLIKPGDRIDVLVSIRQNARVSLVPVLQHTLVLATGARTDARELSEGNADARGFTSMTLEVSPEDARRLFAARETGRLTAVLRTADDEDDEPRQVSDAQSILGLGSAPHERASVKVIYADQLGRRPGAAALLSRLP